MLSLLLRRLGLVGGLEREWTLRAGPARPRAASYRHAELPTVGDLITALERWGYRLALRRAELHGTTERVIEDAMDARHRLVGVGFRVSDGRLPGPGVWIRIGEPTGARESVGFVVARDDRGRGNEELGLFVIAALGELLPGLFYKDLRSALGFDGTELLRGSLPDQPHWLGPRDPA